MAFADIWKKKAKKKDFIDENVSFHEENGDERRMEQETETSKEVKCPIMGIEEAQVKKLSALYNWFKDSTEQKLPEDFYSQLWPIQEKTKEEQQEDETYIPVFVHKLEDACSVYMDLIHEKPDSSDSPDEENEQEIQKSDKKSMNAGVQMYISEDHMTVYLCFFPPVNDGTHVNPAQVTVAMKMARISAGLRQEEINKMVQEKQYFRIFRAADGIRPVSGKDGEIIDHYPREKKTGLQEDEKGNVNLKNMHSYQQIAENDVICDIILPIPGTDGRDVSNRVIKAGGGQSAPVPKGRNTRLNEDGTLLLADTDGYLKFQNGNFEVEKKLFINGNIDFNTGNIDFPGDVEILGDVNAGFEVKATGSISVNGLVEAALLQAGKDIEILKGMNGSRQGRLEAKGAVHSRFLENCMVVAGGDVTADSIVNCDVSTNGSVCVLSGRGTIIGGKITVRKEVQARRIGNRSNCENQITLGNDRLLAKEQEENKKNLEEAEKMLDRVTKNVDYLQSLSSLPESKKILLNQLTEQKNVWEEKRALLKEEKDILNGKKVDYSQCRVIADTIFPYTKIELKFSSLLVKDMTDKCNIYYSMENNELRLGSI